MYPVHPKTLESPLKALDRIDCGRTFRPKLCYSCPLHILEKISRAIK